MVGTAAELSLILESGSAAAQVSWIVVLEGSERGLKLENSAQGQQECSAAAVVYETVVEILLAFLYFLME